MSDVAVLLHGAGSCPQTVRRLLAPAVPRGARVVAPEVRTGAADATRLLARLVDDLPTTDRLVLVAGISLGAHAVAAWAVDRAPAPPLLLVMPAWTGPPGLVAAATAAAAEEVEALGSAAVLDRLRDDPATRGDWVLDELAQGWATYDDDARLARALRAAASSPAPTAARLARVHAPTAVVALADDPLHPERVARLWASAVPGARLAVVPRRACDLDRGALGRAARAVADEDG